MARSIKTTAKPTAVTGRLRELAIAKINDEINNLQAMFEVSTTDKEGVTGFKANTFRENQIKAQIYLIDRLQKIVEGVEIPSHDRNATVSGTLGKRLPPPRRRWPGSATRRNNAGADRYRTRGDRDRRY